MKTILLHFIIVSLFIFCQVISAQEWAPIGAKWYYSNRENPLGGPEQGYLLIESMGDTVINNINVRKLKRTYFPSNGNEYELGFEYVYSKDNKVFYLKESNSYLLYDFNAETGDTLKFKEPFFTGFSPDSTFSLVVDSTNYISPNGINLKIIYFHNIIIDFWDLYNIHIERIGNITYMLPQSSIYCDVQCYDPLRCYTDNIINFKNDMWPFSCDKLITSIENKNLSSNYRIFPNPTNSYIQIETIKNLTETLFINIYDVLGKCVISVEGKSNSSILTVDLSSLSSGIYIMTINKLWQVKIFKQ